MKKRKLKLFPIATVGLLTASLLTSSVLQANAGNYDNMSIPSIITTAYQDAQLAVTRKEKEATQASSTNSSGTTDGSSPPAAAAEATASDAKEAKENLTANIKTLMSIGNFGTTGLLFGPISGNGSLDAYSQLTNSGSVDKNGLSNLDQTAGVGDKALAYHTFGLAITNLKNDAMKTQPSSMDFEEVVGSMEGMATAVSKFGIELVKKYNPLPVIAAFWDSSHLTSSKYAGEDGNELVNLVNQTDTLRSIVKFFGDPIQIGTVTASFGWMATCILAFLSLGGAAFSRLWNGQRFGITIRRNIVRFTVASVGIPIVATYGAQAINWTTAMLTNEKNTTEYAILSNNLHIYNWYKNTAFGLPDGVVLTVRDGKFAFDEETVYAINKYSAKNSVSSDGTASASSETMKKLLSLYLGDQSENKDSSTAVANSTEYNITDKALASAMKRDAYVDKNRKKVVFTPSYGQSGLQAYTGGGDPWETSSIITFAEALGSNKEYKAESDSIANNKYLTEVSLTSSALPDGGGYTYASNGDGYGISPIAAYNLMASTFSNTDLVVSTNTSSIVTPTVATSVITGAAAAKSNNAPALVKFVLLITMMVAGMQALAAIITGGFGGIGRGSAGVAIGSVAGLGSLVGGILAITLGLVGLSAIMLLSLELIDVLWKLLASLIAGKAISQGMDEALSSMLGDLKSAWLIGPLLTGLLKSVFSLVMGFMGILLLPQLVKTPITSYGDWLKSLPDSIAERFLLWEKRFTGDYHTGAGSMFGGSGRSGGGMGGGGSSGSLTDKMKAKEAASRQARSHAMKTGGAMIAGAAASLAGASIASALESKSLKEGDTNENNKVDNNASSESTDLSEREQSTNAEQSAETSQDVQEIQQAEQVSEETQVDGGESLSEQVEDVQTSELNEGDVESTGVELPSDVETPTEGDSLAVGAESATSEVHGDQSMAGKDERTNQFNSKEGADGAKETDSISEKGSEQSQRVNEASQKDSLAQDTKTREDAGKETTNSESRESNELSSDSSNSEMSEQSLSHSAEQGLEREGGKEKVTGVDREGQSKEGLNTDTHSDMTKDSLRDSSEQVSDKDSKESEGKDNSESKTERLNSRQSRFGQMVDRQVKSTKDAAKSLREKATKENLAKATAAGLQQAGGHVVSQTWGSGSKEERAEKRSAAFKEAGKMAGAGAMHAVAGAFGVQGVTTNIAQGQIDKRNERNIAAGRGVTDNLSTKRGESRDQITKRTADTMKARSEAEDAQMAHAEKQRRDKEDRRAQRLNSMNAQKRAKK